MLLLTVDIESSGNQLKLILVSFLVLKNVCCFVGMIFNVSLTIFIPLSRVCPCPPQISKQQLQTVKERFQAFLSGDTQIVADEAFINAVQSYYEVSFHYL